MSDRNASPKPLSRLAGIASKIFLFFYFGPAALAPLYAAYLYVSGRRPAASQEIFLVTVGIGMIWIGVLIYFPRFLATRVRTKAMLSALGLIALLVSQGLYLVDEGVSLNSVVVTGFLATWGIFVVGFTAWALIQPVRRLEQERRQNLLTKIELLADEDPKLYAVAQLVRDDIAISSRQSSLQSWIQSGFFFLAGLAFPYILQLVGPYVLALFQSK